MITPTHHSRTALTLGAVALVVIATAAGAEARTPVRDCGSIAKSGAYAITAQGVTCKSSRAVAQIVPGKRACRPMKSCMVRGYTCLIGQAGKELFLVHCENSTQTRFIRFEYGS